MPDAQLPNSDGLTAFERRILEGLEVGGPQDRESLTHGYAPNMSAESVGRALRRLRTRGLVTNDGRWWELTAAALSTSNEEATGG